MRLNIELCMKFPSVLRYKLLNGELDLPESTRFTYEPIYAYRAVEREADNSSPVTRMDFRSYYELKKTPKHPRGLRQEDYEHDAHYYGASCFTNRKIVEQKLNFPNPRKKLAAGYIVQECGAEHTECYHVCWWLYNGTEINTFTLMEE